jgi:hypothetical protein
MAANNGGHISFVGQAAAGKSAARPETLVYEKQIGHDVDSVYDEEEFIPVKESDFKRRQVCACVAKRLSWLRLTSHLEI